MIPYNPQSRRPSKNRIAGFLIVVLLHGLAFWAVNSGLAKQFVKAVKGPVEAVLIEDAKPDIPPPPPPPPPPADKKPPPPPDFVPPPDTPSVTTAAPANAISAVTTAPPVVAAPPPVAPPPPPPVAPPPPPPPRVIASAALLPGCKPPSYPAASVRAEEEGTSSLRLTIDADGHVISASVDKSSGYPRLDEAAKAAFEKCLFKPATTDGKPMQAAVTRQFVWRLP